MAFKRSGGDWLKVLGPALALVLVGFILAFNFSGPALPKNIRIAAGTKGGNYYAAAQEYAEFFEREGINLEVVETAGSNENLGLLHQKDSGIEVALVQSGMTTTEESPDLFALGSVYYEPLWAFHRNETPLRQLGDLVGKRVAVGQVGSGTRPLATMLLAENGVTAENTTFLDFDTENAADALVGNSVDAVFFVTSANSPLVDRLLRHADVRPFSFARAEGYARKYTYLSQVQMPEGILDFEQNVPSSQINLLAPSATLLAKKSMHPALIDLLLQAARHVHGGADLLSEAGQFPSSKNCDLPLSKDATRYFTYGPPFLQRYLPFWLATWIDRLKVMLLPFVILLLPMAKIIPPVLQWRTRRKVVKWYRRLQEIDLEIRTDVRVDLSKLLDEISQMDNDVAQVSIPLGYADQLYNLRLHVDLIRSMIEKALAEKK